MKKAIALLLSATLALSLCACGTAADPTEPYTPPVQGGFYPSTEPTSDIEVEINTPEKEKFDLSCKNNNCVIDFSLINSMQDMLELINSLGLKLTFSDDYNPYSLDLKRIDKFLKR